MCYLKNGGGWILTILRGLNGELAGEPQRGRNITDVFAGSFVTLRFFVAPYY